MLSLGIEASLAFWMASCREGLPSGSPPPSLAATVIARASLVKSLPRRASTIAFLCLIPAHLECPAIAGPRLSGGHHGNGARGDVRHAEGPDDQRLAPECRAQRAERAPQRRGGPARGGRGEGRPPGGPDAGARAPPAPGGRGDG